MAKMICGVCGLPHSMNKHYGCPGPLKGPEATQIQYVKAYATQNYNADGWDILVECWDDEEIVREIRKSGKLTMDGIIAHIGDILKMMDSHRRDIQGEAF